VFFCCKTTQANTKEKLICNNTTCTSCFRDVVCGKVEFSTTSSQKQRKWETLKAIVEKETEVWGIEIIDAQRLRTTQSNMRRMMANQAEAERSRRARIILVSLGISSGWKTIIAGVN
jgi:hypothetical protein